MNLLHFYLIMTLRARDRIKMIFELKDVVSLVVGTIIGLIAGIAVYWLPLGQFWNEWRAIWNLRKNYKRGDQLTIKAGTDLKPVSSGQAVKSVSVSTRVEVWHDEGVNWHHTANGWKRARIIHVYEANLQGIQPVYKVCHLDVVV